MLKTLTADLQKGTPLSTQAVVAAIDLLASPEITAEEKAQFLTALSVKGETIEEISSFARELRDRSISPPLSQALRQQEILDVCGTGGDRLNTFNISTTVALVAASAGVPVAKHGNRAITSNSGSADVLEALGIRIDLSPEEAAASLEQRHFAFFFAQRYHPTFKNIAPARKLCAEAGQRTIFNFLGPLLNPTRPSAQLMGVARAELCEPIARVLQALNTRRVMVVTGKIGDASLDELSTMGDSHIAEFYHDRGFNISSLSPGMFDLQPATLDDLQGGDSAVNAQIIISILSGKERGPKRDAVLLNSAAALFVAGKAKSLMEGFELAGELIDSGKALAKLRELSEKSI
ncbi:MAG: anthranilate phosphoribosyltransferase [Verrucomicrobiales bacterium]